MKLIFSIACFTVCVSAALSTFCRSEDDCKEGRCCVALSALQMAGKGLCIKLNRNRAKCNAPEAKMDYYGGKYLIYCPCESGLECDTQGAKGFGRCKVAQPTPASPPDVTEEETFPPEVTEEETLPPQVTEEETSSPEEVTEPEVVDEETDEPIVDETGDEETEAPEEETEAPEEETEAPEEETEAPEEETDAPEEEPEGDVREQEEDTEEPEEIGQGPGGGTPRDDDCADWELPC